MNQDGTEIKNDKKQSSHCFVKVFVLEILKVFFSAKADFIILTINMKYIIRYVLEIS